MESGCFSVDVERDGTTVRLRMAGDFDRAAIDQFERALEAARGLPLERVILDLSALTFLDMAALRVILGAYRHGQADAVDMTVVRPRGLASRVFTLTRAGEILSTTDHPTDPS